jgi:hypothetical protein
MNVYHVGQDDANWVMDLLCSDANGPVELAAATGIQIYLSTLDGRRPDLIVSATAVADYAFTVGTLGQPGYFNNPGTSGKHCIARHTGSAAEASVVGDYQGRVQATWGDGTVRSFPTTTNYFVMSVSLRPA